MTAGFSSDSAICTFCGVGGMWKHGWLQNILCCFLDLRWCCCLGKEAEGFYFFDGNSQNQPAVKKVGSLVFILFSEACRFQNWASQGASRRLYCCCSALSQTAPTTGFPKKPISALRANLTEALALVFYSGANNAVMSSSSRGFSAAVLLYKELGTCASACGFKPQQTSLVVLLSLCLTKMALGPWCFQFCFSIWLARPR